MLCTISYIFSEATIEIAMLRSYDGVKYTIIDTGKKKKNVSFGLHWYGFSAGPCETHMIVFRDLSREQI